MTIVDKLIDLERLALFAPIGSMVEVEPSILLTLLRAYEEMLTFKDRVQELESTAHSKAGAVLRSVRACFERDAGWTTEAILADLGPSVSQKAVYNALGYLVRHKQIQRVSYGVYRRPITDESAR